MKNHSFTRRQFVVTGFAGTLAIASGFGFSTQKPVVSIVKIKDGNTGFAVEEAIDLLGGIKEVAKDKKRIMLKPNLVAPDASMTTKPEVIEALARMFQTEGKEVCIGEGSAGAPGFNIKGEETFRTKKNDILNPMQQHVFEVLGYTTLSEKMNIPLINLHSGEMVEVEIPGGFLSDRITLHKSLSEIDMLVSVPMMKTHVLATVTLGMKNLIGLYPGSVYCSVRACLHDSGMSKNSPGIAYEILDMVKACTPGLVVIDASTAMEGNGPSNGELVKTNLIIAGTNPLATDMVAARIMGFHHNEVPTFVTAIEHGMKPSGLAEIEIRGEHIEDVLHQFKRPQLLKWKDIHSVWGANEI